MWTKGLQHIPKCAASTNWFFRCFGFCRFSVAWVSNFFLLNSAHLSYSFKFQGCKLTWADSSIPLVDVCRIRWNTKCRFRQPISFVKSVVIYFALATRSLTVTSKCVKILLPGTAAKEIPTSQHCVVLNPLPLFGSHNDVFPIFNGKGNNWQKPHFGHVSWYLPHLVVAWLVRSFNITLVLWTFWVTFFLKFYCRWWRKKKQFHHFKLIPNNITKPCKN